jgi:MFS family permease
MTVWAIISGLTALSRNYTGLLLTRFFLGITEAPYYPGALYILARFYTRKELATRISILYTGNILATAFAGLIALGIFEMDGMVGASLPPTVDTANEKRPTLRDGNGCSSSKAP